MMDEFEPVLSEATVTCHISGCPNEGLSIVMLVCETVYCGPCGNEIVDVVPTG